jgi:hypothetical protein
MAAIGDRVGPFALTGLLEVDGGLELWEGVRADERLKDPYEVWVRVLAAEDEAQAVRLRREYEALRLIEDPRVPVVVGFFAGQGSLATTRLSGVPLRQVLRGAEDGLVKLEPATALDIVLEVAHALRAAHSILGGPRIVHGALSADHVRIGKGGAVGVMGLGAGLSCPGHYQAPECLLQGVEPTLLSDQWQLGALLFELLTLRSLVLPLPIPGLRKDVGRQLELLEPADQRLLRRMVAPDPKDRFQVARELLHALHQRAREVGGTSARKGLFDRTMFVRERLEDPTDAPQVTGELPLSTDEVSQEISVSDAMMATLDVELDSLELDLPLLGRAADQLPPEDLLTEPLPSIVETPAPPAAPEVPPEPPRVRTPGEWTVLLLALLFLVCILWWVTTRLA